MKAFYRGLSYDLSHLAAPIYSTDAQPSFRGHTFDLADLESPSPLSLRDAQYRGHKLVSGNRRNRRSRPAADRLSRTLSSLEDKCLAH